MNIRKKIAVVFGTRPDTIKMAPIILELEKYPEQFDVLTIATAQHRQMLDQVLEVFNIKTSYDLDIMAPKQSLASLTARIITGLDKIFADEKPDMVLVQGDTTTTCIGSLAAFYQQIPVGHVEAGICSGLRHECPVSAGRLEPLVVADQLYLVAGQNSPQRDFKYVGDTPCPAQ